MPSVMILGTMWGGTRPPVSLAELAGAGQTGVDRGRVNMPTRHPQNLTGAGRELLPEADVVLGLDVQDMYGGLAAGVRERGAPPTVPEDAQIATISMNEYLQRSWAADYHRLVPVDLALGGDTGTSR
jgi:acetolactate synthase-1/2/3 large subunit